MDSRGQARKGYVVVAERIVCCGGEARDEDQLGLVCDGRVRRCDEAQCVYLRKEGGGKAQTHKRRRTRSRRLEVRICLPPSPRGPGWVPMHAQCVRDDSGVDGIRIAS